ncbi:hypothetical protein HRI_002153900 [Hibiscus trionum]|uniref:RRM domain-containing protein n=1 Tax=Hibiscus trionum TaxID=183268 RepID=A0A9W7M259_HIBTR|nr:hypothetical protein HRI_002153900 [Hibiscus trionum]
MESVWRKKETKRPGQNWKGDSDQNQVEWVVFVDNLSRRVSRGALREFFCHYEEVKRVFIPYDNRKPKYRDCTFAFVHFAEERGMIRAIELVNNSKIYARKVTVSKSRF